MSAKRNDVELSPQPLVGRDPETGRFIRLPRKFSNTCRLKLEQNQEPLLGLTAIAFLIFFGWGACNVSIVLYLFYWVIISCLILYLIFLWFGAILRAELNIIATTLIGFFTPIIYFASIFYLLGRRPS